MIEIKDNFVLSTKKISVEEIIDKLIEEGRLTCINCDDVNNCEFAYDPYNTGGDCLALK